MNAAVATVGGGVVNSLLSTVVGVDRKKEASIIVAEARLLVQDMELTAYSKIANDDSFVELQLLGAEVERARKDVRKKGRPWYRKLKEPDVHLDKINHDIGAINTKIRVLFNRGQHSQTQQITSTSEQITDLQAQFPEESSEISQRAWATRNVAPVRKQLAAPMRTGYEILDPKSRQNYHILIQEIQRRNQGEDSLCTPLLSRG